MNVKSGNPNTFMNGKQDTPTPFVIGGTLYHISTRKCHGYIIEWLRTNLTMPFGRISLCNLD